MVTGPYLSKKSLGYQIHTNRELGMMLRREKPLAVFCDIEDAQPESVRRYLRMFDRHVLSGKFVKREHREPFDFRGRPRTVLTILYALPDEAWRIDEMMKLRQQMHYQRWTEQHERHEGMLLGYTDAQNDAWIARKVKETRS